ncbi:MAG: hypothetical protein CUN56_00445 [Phototrophicales bacterium]|nr:MAG: hypothetical protein CUN56_00445 [Phototrophicales bacterium]
MLSAFDFLVDKTCAKVSLKVKMFAPRATPKDEGLGDHRRYVGQISATIGIEHMSQLTSFGVERKQK